MDPYSQIEHLADMAREHQAEILRIAQTEGVRRPSFGRLGVGLAVLIVLALPAAFLFVRAW
jgi:hypothetical protein